MTDKLTQSAAIALLRRSIEYALKYQQIIPTKCEEAMVEALAATASVEAPTSAVAEPDEIYLQAKLKGDGWVEVNARQHAAYVTAGTPVRTLYCYVGPASIMPEPSAPSQAKSEQATTGKEAK